MRSRVLMLSWEYPPVIEGGLARHVCKLAEGLSEQRVAVDVLTRGARDAPELQLCGEVAVHRVQEPAWPKDLERFIAWVKQMNDDLVSLGRKLARNRAYQVVHGHDWLVAKAAVQLSRELSIPYVTTVHATEHGRHSGWVHEQPQAHIHEVERWMSRQAQSVVVCSNYMKRHVCEIFDLDARRVEVIPNGIDRRDLRPAEDLESLRSRFASPHERLVLLVGRLVYEKGFQVALDALAAVVSKLEGVRFLVAGSGTHEEELRSQAKRLGLQAHGKFVGWIGDEALASLYRVADLCVVPSLYEPFGLVPLEAMASGCPCIVANIGGLREVIPAGGRVGLRFDGGDSAHLGSMIERVLLDEALRRRLIAESGEHVLRFDWREIAGKTAAVYDAAIASREPRPSAKARFSQLRRRSRSCSKA